MTNITEQYQAQSGHWSLWDQQRQRELVVFTSFLGMEFRSRAHLPRQPLEQGGFFQYNKIATPADVRVTLAREGDAQSLSAVLDELSLAVADTRLLTVQTPGHVLSSMNLESYDYRRRTERGVSLLVVDLQLTEIRQLPPRAGGLGLSQVFLPADASALLRGRVQAKVWDSQWQIEGGPRV